MTKFITLEDAKFQCRVDADITIEDPLLNAFIEAASGAVINYLKETAEDFVDSSGELIVDSSGNDAVPAEVKQAVRVLVAIFYRDREGEGGMINPAFDRGYLPAPVTALLYPLRDPALR